MVLEDRVYYRIPRAKRSVRRRRELKRKDDSRQTRAFEILADVAGKILSETKNSQPSSDSSLENYQTVAAEEDSKEEKDDKDKFLEEKSFRERNFTFTELVDEDLGTKDVKSYELNHIQNDTILGSASKLMTSDCSEKVNDDCKLQLGVSVPSLDVKCHSSHRSEDEGNRKIVRTAVAKNRNSSCYLGVRQPLQGKSSPSVSSFGSVKFPACKDQTTRGPVPSNWDSVNSVTRDNDDDNYSECFEPRSGNDSFYKPPLRVADRRLKKILEANHCRASADGKDDKHIPGTESCSNMNRESILKRQRSINDYPIKKRKLYEGTSVSSHNEDVRSDGTQNVTQSVSDKIGHCSDQTMVGASSKKIHASSNHVSFQPRNHHGQVKLMIKSFMVPELHIEIPETASVGSLKRAVMEAVKSELGGGPRVGVLLHGTEIEDDSKTLLQSGISHNNAKDSLIFSLEPKNAPTRDTRLPEDSAHQHLHHNPQPLARYRPTSATTQYGFHHGRVEGNFDRRLSINKHSFDNYIYDNCYSAQCSDTVISDKASTESKVIVPLQTIMQDDDALSALPLRKSKRSKFAQRRIRRPFTVSEVEALVQAVEELGTGRWRDVKLSAFDHAKHRTYVDLKDKWKTLVHTARISPQQRRGEPVPQELLNRVLAAQAYWSQQQAKQQLKSQPDTCLLL